ncbi:MAG: Helix-turn-helix domain [Thermomicrobiales bacterium]|jgi:excisionase family DNA binding protein|nr:Helix-turn-helix domain [Thermomicrobiales bacterium]
MHDDEATPARAWLTVEEAARIAGVHRYSVYKWIRWGWLAPLPADDGRFRIAADDLARLLATRRAAADLGVRPRTLRNWAADDSPEA